MLGRFVAAAVAAFLVLAPVAASAHAVLVWSSPAGKSTVTGPEQDATLRFNSRIDAARSKLSLKGPDGVKALEIKAGKTEAELTSHLSNLVPGKYVLHFDVLSIDGHISRGDLPFTVGAP
ncbi:MAG: copper resistance protein CopC [Actinomycetota bacterium]